MSTITKTINKNKSPKRLSDSTQCYLLISLQIIGFLVFTIYPIIWAVSKSWFYYNGVDAETSFVGWENFAIAFSDAKYWSSWIVTFKFTFYKIIIEIPLALVLATLLSKGRKGSNAFRSIFYLPNIISVAIVGVMVSNLFDYYGVMNKILSALGLVKNPIDWFANSSTSLGVLVAGSTWSSFGINMLYFCAALNNVPKDMYEAADIDGAGKIRQFFNITIPMIAPVASTILLLAINGTLHVGEYILVTTGGGPAGTTNTVGSYLIDAFVPGFADTAVNIGYGCALALITTVIYSVIAVIYSKSTKKLQNIY